MTLRKRVDAGFEEGSTISHSAENLHWKKLQTCRRADSRTKERHDFDYNTVFYVKILTLSCQYSLCSKCYQTVRHTTTNCLAATTRFFPSVYPPTLTPLSIATNWDTNSRMNNEWWVRMCMENSGQGQGLLKHSMSKSVHCTDLLILHVLPSSVHRTVVKTFTPSIRLGT
jgi:hypothetical protein